MELFERQCQESPQKARWHYVMNVIRFMRWRYIKDLEDFQPKRTMAMFKTYFKISARNMIKNKWQALLNVFGLALGIACCMLILTHVRHQTSFDSHVSNGENIYRVTINGTGPYTPALLVKNMIADYPEVINGVRMGGLGESVIQLNDQYFKQEDVLMADSTFFELFTTTFLRGDSHSALNGERDVVVTESIANKYYPNQDPMGKILNIDDVDYVISAVVVDPPRTSTIPYKMIQAIPWEQWATVGDWTGNNFYSFLQLQEGARPEYLEAKFHDFIKKYVGPQILKYYPQYSSYEDYVDDGNHHTFVLIPLLDIHLNHPRLTLGNPGNADNLLVFSFIAGFILILACINYVNMSTAKSSLRAKEIGMRKVMGSVKGQITQQFLVESFVLAGLSILLGSGLAILAIPYFNMISGWEYQLTDLLNWENALWFVVIWLIVGLMAGVYPALYLASFKPIMALKGESRQGGNSKLRSGLVVLQFAISIFLLMATFVVYSQLQHMTNRKLGVDADQVFVIGDGQKIAAKYQAFKTALKSNSYIEEVAVSSSFPSQRMSDWNYSTVGENSVTIGPFNLFVDPSVQAAWGLKVKEGRFFEKQRASDTSSIVVNQKLVDELGWDDPIGQTLSRGTGEDFRVIGVVENFVTRTAKRGDYPLLMRYVDVQSMSGSGFISVKIKGNVLAALDHVETVWNSLLPGYPMDGQFMDDSFQRMYDEERKFGLLFTGFTTIAILIACLGLFSLAAFILERRKKEIALRKVLGARVGQIFTNVSRYFLGLIAVAASIALPVGFLLGDKWLEDYVDRVHITLWMLLVPLVIILAISLLTVSFQTYKSAVGNPVDALKDE